MHRLFLPFERLDAEREGIEGSGLGLAISKRLVELMGGSIGVESVKGEGCRFWIEVPLSPAAAERDPAAEAGGGGLEALAGTVLYIEDNSANYKLVQEVLEPYPAIRVEGAATGEEGLAKVAALRPDAILLDLQLPGMSGQEVFEVLKRDWPRIPVLVVSADASPSRIRYLRESGAFSYLTKPLEMLSFLECLAGALGGKGEDEIL
jgi:CheY-like chemotaxis protein